MAKKIKLTENQLKNVVNVLSEENFDQALTTHQREKEREVLGRVIMAARMHIDLLKHADKVVTLEDIALKLKNAVREK